MDFLLTHLKAKSMFFQNVRQEHVVRLFEAFVHEGFVFLVFEKLYGENVARSLSLKHKYTEYQVSSIIKQVCHFVIRYCFVFKHFYPSL